MNIETKIRVEKDSRPCVARREEYTSVWLDHYVDGNREVVSPTLILRVPTRSIAHLDPEKHSFDELVAAVKEDSWYQPSK